MKKVIIGVIATIAIIVAASFFLGSKIESKFIREPHVDIQNSELRKAKSSYYRLQANYKIVSSGEIVTFDYIFACSKVIHETKYDYGQIISGPISKFNIWFPESVYMPTSTGAALQVSTPKICGAVEMNALKGTPHPYTIFHPDINNLTTGWGYATYHAYERPNAELKYLGGFVTPASKSQFIKWRKNAMTAFDPKSGLPDPYGTYSRDAARKWKLKNPKTHWYEYAKIGQCAGRYYYPVQAELKSELKKLQPESKPRFWSVYAARENKQQQLVLFNKIQRDNEKRDPKNKNLRFKNEYRPVEGTPASDGSGTVLDQFSETIVFRRSTPTPIYPYLDYFLQQWPDGVQQDPNILPASILFSEKYKGLAFCSSSFTRSSSYGPARGKTKTLFIQSLPVDGITGPIFSSEGGVFK